MPLSIGLVLNNRYRIDSLLGQGGMGAVYRAWDLNLKMDVAVKVNFAADPEAQRQFEREAGILARLSHPNLPRVTDYFFISDQGQFLVMDYVEGEDLQSMLDRLGVLPESQVLDWILEVCDALSYLHSQPSPIIHRDIKPANIRIRPDGRAMLVDFGIAKIYDPERSTTVGAQAVTPGYSPPEQYGGGLTDARSDIYALGATLYHLLTGEVPPESIHLMVRVSSLASPRHLNQSISPMVERSVIKAIEIETDRRFQSIDEFQDALSSRPTVVQRVSASDSMRAMEVRSVPQERHSNRNPWLVLAGGGSLVAIVLAISMLVLSQILRTAQVTPTAMIADLKTDTPLVADHPTATGYVSMTGTATPTGQAGAIHPTAEISESIPTLVSTSTPRPEPTPTCPSVKGPFADEWHAIQDKLGCATGDTVEGVIVEENFEGGKMFWREPVDVAQALVLFNDGTWRIFQHPPYAEGSPEFSCLDENTPPQCPPTPKRGFGMMWCDISEIRSRLGNATDCEFDYRGPMQELERGFMLQDKGGAVYAFYDGGQWEHTSTVSRRPTVAYQPLPLETVANGTLGFKSPLSGDVVLGGVLFQLSPMVFQSQASPSPNDRFPTSASLSADIFQAQRVHLLLTAGNGFNQFDGQIIGQIVIHCSGDAVSVVDLQLGRDIREWHAAHNVVSTATHGQQVWSGALDDFPNLTGHIDMLSLDLPTACREGNLTGLEVVDTSTGTVNSLDPALNLIGVTVEYYR